MNDLENFIKTLKYQKYSAGSVHNYKSDVNQFLAWKTSQKDIQDNRALLNQYQSILKRNYKKSTVKRKVSSITAYLDYVDPIVDSKVIKPSSYIKQQRNAIFLGGYSIALLLIVSLILTSSRQSINPTAEPRNIELEDKNVQVSNSIKPFDSNDIKVSISAPEGTDANYDLAKSRDFLINHVEIDQNNAFSGRSEIRALNTSTIIYSDAISRDSIIHLTLRSKLDRGNIYIASQNDGWAEISITESANQEVQFNWAVSEVFLDREML